MSCIYADLKDGTCNLWEKDSPLNPEGANADEGYCTAEDDEDPSWCQSFEDSNPEVCDFCGEELGFCAADCEGREEEDYGG